METPPLIRALPYAQADTASAWPRVISAVGIVCAVVGIADAVSGSLHIWSFLNPNPNFSFSTSSVLGPAGRPFEMGMYSLLGISGLAMAIASIACLARINLRWLLAASAIGVLIVRLSTSAVSMLTFRQWGSGAMPAYFLTLMAIQFLESVALPTLVLILLLRHPRGPTPTA